MRNKSSFRFFYLRLAVTNMQKNGGIYLPWLLAGTFVAGLFYVVSAVGEMVESSAMKGGEQMRAILSMCAPLCIVLMFLILFYINSFVMKRRKRELGLYCVLGMEKRHLCRILSGEMFCSAVVSIFFGILFGILFSQLLFLLLLKLLKLPAQLVFAIPFTSVTTTVFVFALGYTALLFYNWVVILRSNPIELQKSRQEGEKEPKTKWFFLVVGIMTLVAGYGLALRVGRALEAILVFFPAAFLVIIATYCLFQAGSIALLKFLKKRKRFYYRPGNFIAVSGMLYRMKQNAAGLATIAILSTTLLVVLSCSVTLYSGEEERIKTMYPRAYRLEVKPEVYQNSELSLAQMEASDSCDADVTQALRDLAQRTDAKLCNDYSYYSAWWLSEKKGNCFTEKLAAGYIEDMDLDKMAAVTWLSLEDYNRITGEEESLADNELILASADWGKDTTVIMGDNEFHLKKVIPEIEELAADEINQDILDNYVFVTPNKTAMLALAGTDAGTRNVEWNYHFDLEGTQEAREAFFKQMWTDLNISGLSGLVSREEERDVFYTLYGSLLFIGILFSCLFLVATVLIIYYKQVTEGYDDRERFIIMEKVGMKDTEIRRAIGKQVLIVFFLPLVTAIVHILVAARVLRLFLLLLGLANKELFWWCIAVCCIVFGVVYYGVYRLTSRTYYKIVHGNVG